MFEVVAEHWQLIAGTGGILSAVLFVMRRIIRWLDCLYFLQQCNGRLEKIESLLASMEHEAEYSEQRLERLLGSLRHQKNGQTKSSSE